MATEALNSFGRFPSLACLTHVQILPSWRAFAFVRAYNLEDTRSFPARRAAYRVCYSCAPILGGGFAERLTADLLTRS
jgi:hypothetical protein